MALLAASDTKHMRRNLPNVKKTRHQSSFFVHEWEIKFWQELSVGPKMTAEVHGLVKTIRSGIHVLAQKGVKPSTPG